MDVDSLALEEFKLKEYFTELTLENARIKYRERSSTMNSCRSHYSNCKENISKLFRCFHCMEIDSLFHWKNSECYKELRKNRDLSQDSQLVQFYREIISIRKEMSEEDS